MRDVSSADFEYGLRLPAEVGELLHSVARGSSPEVVTIDATVLANIYQALGTDPGIGYDPFGEEWFTELAEMLEKHLDPEDKPEIPKSRLSKEAGRKGRTR